MEDIRIIPGQRLGGFDLVAPPPGVCQECAVKHAPGSPHNQQSLFYQYKFYNDHGRWPTWTDAMAHCSPEMQQFWRESLEAKGIDIGAPEITRDGG